MTSGRQATAIRQQAQEVSEPEAPKWQFVAVAHDPKCARLSRSLVIPGEDVDALVALRQSLAEDLKPKGMLENECIDEITACLWRVRRMHVIEARLFEEAISRDSVVDESGQTSCDASARLDPNRHNPQELRPESDMKVDSLSNPEPMVATSEHEAEENERPNDVSDPLASEEKNCVLGRAFDCAQEILVKLTGHESKLQRSLNRALRTLERLQMARGDVTVLDIEES